MTPAATVHLPQSISAHPLLAPLGISVLPVQPCRLDCPQCMEAAERWFELAAGQGYATEAGWFRECFAWAMSWSELHGVIEVKTPVFKMCLVIESNPRPRLILRKGTAEVEGSIPGLSFPWAPKRRADELVGIGGIA